MTPRIIIPHGLAADVLRVLGDGKPRACAAIVDAIDELRGYGDETPGVGFAPVWRQLRQLRKARVLTGRPTNASTMWTVKP